MPEVNVEINGRKFRMACEEGQEEHLTQLAVRFNQQVEQFKGSFGEIGDNRLTVMAGIAVLDQLHEMEAKLADAETRINDLKVEMTEVERGRQEQEQAFAKKLADTARKIEAVATVVDETASKH